MYMYVCIYIDFICTDVYELCMVDICVCAFCTFNVYVYK